MVSQSSRQASSQEHDDAKKYAQLENDLGEQLFWILHFRPNLRLKGKSKKEVALALLHAIYKRIGEDPNTPSLSTIGQGADASVYWLKKNRGRVLKVTRSKEDAMAMESFRKKPSKDLVKVEDVFQILPGLYGIVTQKLTPLSNSQQTKFFDDKYIINDYGFIFLGEKPNYDDVRENIAEEIDFFKNEEKNPQEVKNLEDLLPTLDQLDKWTSDLHKRGIVFQDLHPGNIMMDRHNMVLMDLGRSKVRQVKIPILEVQGL